MNPTNRWTSLPGPPLRRIRFHDSGGRTLGVVSAFILLAALGLAVALSREYSPIFLALGLSALLAFPFVSRLIKDPAEPAALFAAIASTYVIGALDIIFNREGRLQHVKNLFDAGLTRHEAAPYLDLALIFVMSGVVAFFVGYFIKLPKTASRDWRAAGPILPAARQSIPNNLLFWATTVSVFLATIPPVLQFLALSDVIGGALQVLGLMRAAGRAALEVDPTISTLWIPTLPAVNAFWYAFYLRKPDKGWTIRVLFWCHFLLASAMVLALGGRTKLIAHWVVLLLIRLSVRRPWQKPSWKGIFAVGILAVVALVSILAWRDASAGRRFSFQRLSESASFYASPQGFYNAVVGRDDFTNLALLGHLIYCVPRETPLQYGRTFVSWAEWVVPRQIWPSKPRSAYTTGHFTRDVLGGGHLAGGVPPNLIAELYLNFHLPGILVGMGCLGLVGRKLYAWSRRRWKDPIPSFIYSYLAVRLFLILPGADVSITVFGSIASIAMVTAVALAALFAASILSRAVSGTARTVART